jgi:hypothetical protein
MNVRWRAHSTVQDNWDITTDADESIAHIFTGAEDARLIAQAHDFYDLATQFERAISGLEKPLRTTFEHLLLSYDKLSARIKEETRMITLLC